MLSSSHFGDFEPNQCNQRSSGDRCATGCGGEYFFLFRFRNAGMSCRWARCGAVGVVADSCACLHLDHLLAEVWRSDRRSFGRPLGVEWRMYGPRACCCSCAQRIPGETRSRDDEFASANASGHDEHCAGEGAILMASAPVARVCGCLEQSMA